MNTQIQKAENQNQDQGGLMVIVGTFFSNIAQKYLPDALVFAVGLSLIGFFAAELKH